MLPMLNKRLSFLLLSGALLLGMASCGEGEKTTAVSLDFGTYVGNQATDVINARSQILWIKRSKLNQLVTGKASFLLLLHGSGDECTCYTEWHNNCLAPYVKQNKLLVYGIELSEFESESEYYGVPRHSGAETFCVFEGGTLRYYHDTTNLQDPFVNQYSAFYEWMKQRVSFPKIYTVSTEILEGFYEGNDPFTVYFGRDTCPDCSYLTNTLLRDYLKTTKVVKQNFLYFDFDVFYAKKDTPEYEGYLQKKAEYGLAESEDNPAGMGAGLFPTVYFVQPNGNDKTGDVIQASGVFFNESVKDSLISGSYFTQERYEDGKDSYLCYLADDVNVKSKWIEGSPIEVAGKTRDDLHEALKPFEEPLFKSLLDFSVADE